MLWEHGNRRQDWRESGPMEKVAVIVPFYNSEPYFEQCLNSLVNQDYEKYEIYLIDDRGSDGSLTIAERFQAEYPALIRILRNDVNIGQGRSRIRAVQMTDAAYVMFVDSDDYVSSDYISRYMAENTDDYDMIVGSFIRPSRSSTATIRSCCTPSRAARHTSGHSCWKTTLIFLTAGRAKTSIFLSPAMRAWPATKLYPISATTIGIIRPPRRRV